MSFNKLKKILNSKTHNNLDKVVQRAKDIEELHLLINNNLNKETASHIIGCNLDDSGKLVILCDSIAWTAKLRFENNKILKIARKRFPKTVSCDIKTSKV